MASVSVLEQYITAEYFLSHRINWNLVNGEWYSLSSNFKLSIPVLHETIFCIANFQILALQAHVRLESQAIIPIALRFVTEKPV